MMKLCTGLVKYSNDWYLVILSQSKVVLVNYFWNQFLLQSLKRNYTEIKKFTNREKPLRRNCTEIRKFIKEGNADSALVPDGAIRKHQESQATGKSIFCKA